jgi:hypothetical protein
MEVNSLGEDGQPSGLKVWLLYVPVAHLAQHSSYKQHETGIESQCDGAKNPGEAAQKMAADKYQARALSFLKDEDGSDLSYHNRCAGFKNAGPAARTPTNFTRKIIITNFNI